MINKIWIFLFITIPLCLFAENKTGRVLDASNNQGLPFVNIIIQNSKTGTVSDIDGNFELKNFKADDDILFSLIGYEKLILKGKDLISNNSTIKMKVNAFNIKEVKVFPGYNPAHRIIDKVLENKRENNFEKISFFTVSSYNKFVFTSEKSDSLDLAYYDDGIIVKDSFVLAAKKLDQKSDSLKQAKNKKKVQNQSTQKKDTSDNSDGFDLFLNKGHLFVTESILDYYHKYPEKQKRIVRATKTSGFKDPLFSLLASQFSSFNIYSDFIEAGSDKYLSPISYGCKSSYLFELKDSFKRGNDSIFVITFRPKKGKRFKGMIGILTINSNKWAIESVKARPIDKSGALSTEITQIFELVENHWFPKQIFSKLVISRMGPIQVIEDSGQKNLVGKGKTYFNIPDFQNKPKNTLFNATSFEVDPKALDKDEAYWKSVRKDSFTAKDTFTFMILDSVGKAFKFDKKLKGLKAIASGRFPIGIVDILLDRFFAFNGYEGFRFGTGLATNNKLSKTLKLSVYGAYGTKDHEFKYGSKLELYPLKDKRLIFSAFHTQDVAELGFSDFYMKRRILPSENSNLFYITQMFKYQRTAFDISFLPFRYSKFVLGIERTQESIKNSNYLYINNKEFGKVSNAFNYVEFSTGFRYAFREKIIDIPGLEIVEKSNYPILTVNVQTPLSDLNLGGDKMSYLKLDASISKSFDIKLAGKSSFLLRVGSLIGDAPYWKLNSGFGSISGNTQVYILSSNYFETMPVFTYFSNNYGTLHYTHSFEEYIIKKRKFKPIFNIHTNLGFGVLMDANIHKNKDLKDYRLGYYESGISINRLLKFSGTGFGIGLYTRYGPYATNDFIKNSYIKVSITNDLIFGLINP